MVDKGTETAGDDGEDEGVRIVCCDACEGSGIVEVYIRSLRCWICEGTGLVEVEVTPITLEDLEAIEQDFGEGS